MEGRKLVNLRYLGQCGFAIHVSGLCLVTDPYLSDALDRNATEAQPWRRAYPPPATLAELSPDVILISHGHADHLDPETLSPYTAQGGQAPVVVPAPLCEWTERFAANVCAARADEPLRFGNVTVTPIPCAHTQLQRDENGDDLALSYLIEGDGRRIFFGGDMSLYDGVVERIRDMRPDLLLLPANGADYFRTRSGIIGNLSCIEAAKLTAACGCQRYVPMHHDLYPFNGCRTGWIEDSARDEGIEATILACGQSLTL